MRTDANSTPPRELYYCGISIEDLAGVHRHSFGYEETAFLLLTGMRPTSSQLDQFTSYLATRRSLSVRFRNDLSDIVNNNMTNSLQRAVSNLYGEDHRLEQLVQNRLIRPAHLNAMPKRPYVPMEQRK